MYVCIYIYIYIFIIRYIYIYIYEEPKIIWYKINVDNSNIFYNTEVDYNK